MDSPWIEWKISLMVSTHDSDCQARRLDSESTGRTIIEKTLSRVCCWAAVDDAETPSRCRHPCWHLSPAPDSQVQFRLRETYAEGDLLLETHLNDLPQRQKFSGAAQDRRRRTGHQQDSRPDRAFLEQHIDEDRFLDFVSTRSPVFKARPLPKSKKKRST